MLQDIYIYIYIYIYIWKSQQAFGHDIALYYVIIHPCNYAMGFQPFLWHRATPVIVGWFAGRTWKNNNWLT